MIKGHGDDIYLYEHLIQSNFSSNVPNYIDHSELYAFLCSKIHTISNYPEPEPARLEEEFAHFFHISSNNICITNGATEGIYLLAQAFKCSKSAIWIPTFSEYADACHLHNHQVYNFNHCKNIPLDAQLIWLCNPNNPTGEVRKYEDLQNLITTYSDKIFIIDQSYECFTTERIFKINEGIKYPNVILIHSLTKHFGIPGLRIGYLTANSTIIEKIRSQRMPWSVNSLAIEAGFYALNKKLELPFDLDSYLKLKDRFINELSLLNIGQIYPSKTHFFLMQLYKGKAKILKDYLANEYGILIRDASNFEGLDDSFLRLATQTPKENQTLINALSKWKNLNL